MNGRSLAAEKHWRDSQDQAKIAEQAKFT